MVTKEAMLNGTWYHICDGEKCRPVYKYKGYEAEATPEYALANDVRNGEWFIAIDTDAMLQWDAEAKTWIKK